MQIIGHGIDVVEIEKIRLLIDEPESDFVSRCFTLKEQESVASGLNRVRHLAGRFAAKEAVAKALGTGFDGTVAPLDIEIRSRPSGAPEIILHGVASEVAKTLGVTAWHVSISHADSVAAASIIALGAILTE